MATSVIRTDLPQSALAIQLQLEDLLNMGIVKIYQSNFGTLLLALSFSLKAQLLFDALSKDFLKYRKGKRCASVFYCGNGLLPNSFIS